MVTDELDTQSNPQMWFKVPMFEGDLRRKPRDYFEDGHPERGVERRLETA